MTVEYWPRDEYDCTEESRRIEDPRTVHFHCRSDEEVVRVMEDHAPWLLLRSFGGHNEEGRDGYHTHPCWPLVGLACGTRNLCVTGPGGLVRRIVR